MSSSYLKNIDYSFFYPARQDASLTIPSVIMVRVLVLKSINVQLPKSVTQDDERPSFCKHHNRQEAAKGKRKTVHCKWLSELPELPVPGAGGGVAIGKVRALRSQLPVKSTYCQRLAD